MSYPNLLLRISVDIFPVFQLVDLGKWFYNQPVWQQNLLLTDEFIHEMSLGPTCDEFG